MQLIKTVEMLLIVKLFFPLIALGEEHIKIKILDNYP